MMSVTDLVAIVMNTLRIDNRCSMEKEYIKLISMNPLMVLYLTFNLLIHVKIMFVVP